MLRRTSNRVMKQVDKMLLSVVGCHLLGMSVKLHQHTDHVGARNDGFNLVGSMYRTVVGR
jgi:hypothetical protein